MKQIPLCRRVTVTIDGLQFPVCRTHSDFQGQIEKVTGYLQQARDNLLDIEDCIKQMKLRIKDQSGVVEKYLEEVARYDLCVARERSSAEADEGKMAGYRIAIAELQGSIDQANDMVAACRKSIQGCHDLREPWRLARDVRRKMLASLKETYQRGRRQDGTPRECGAQTTIRGRRCVNPRQHLDGAWQACAKHYQA